MAPPGTFHHPLPALAFLFLLSLVCASHPGDDHAHAGGSCIESERRALLAIKGDIRHSSVLLSSWRGRDCCHWEGVGYNKLTGHVNKLDLHCTLFDICYWVPSKVNPSLSQLTHLKYLDLSFNYFNNTPYLEFIGSLIHLRHLDLSSAGFYGMVPHQLGNLSNLEYLDLSINYFNETPIPEFIGSLIHLSHLDLSSAGFDGMVPHQLGNLSSLEYLDLSFNYFEEAPIPEFIGSLIHLSHLHLSFAKFGGMVPHQLGNLSNLDYLDLSRNYFNPNPIPEFIGSLIHLSHLNLSSAGFDGMVPHQLANLSSLRYLDLSSNNLSGSDLHWLFKLRSLSVLRLGDAFLSDSNLATLSHVTFTTLTTLDLSKKFLLSSTVPLWIFNISSLTNLYLSSCNFSGGLLATIGNLYNLQLLYTSENALSGEIPRTLGSLARLKYLDLSGNRISGDIPETMGKLCKLYSLDMSYNSIGGEITDLLDGLSECHENHPSDDPDWFPSGLNFLALGNNELNGTIPESLGHLSHLSFLDLYHNLFVGALTEVHFAQSVRLLDFDLSYNNLSMNVTEDWVLPSQLRSIRLCSCPLGPKFPLWLRRQVSLAELCISEAGITENFPAWFWNSSSIGISSLNASHNDMKGHLPALVTNVFTVFDVSFNRFQGTIPVFISPSMYLIDLSNNSFSGPILFSYATNEDLIILSLSYNYITGTVPDSFCNLTSTRVLKLSNNDLSGRLPNCWHSSSQLEVLDLSHNNFSGKIPGSMGNLMLLQSLHMRNNGLSGEIPSSWNNLSQLVTLDVGENKLSGTIPAWIGENLSSLRVLCLRSNLFHGNIPLQISHLTSLQVLDLAHNHLSGILPPFRNFTAMVTVPKGEESMLAEPGDSTLPNASITAKSLHHYYSESLLITAKGSQRDYTTVLSLVTSIDLSDNNLSGKIPEELTRLVGLRFLYLSANHFVGKIPENISQMLLLESLDLSINNLSGKIPNGNAHLNFLSYLNLSSNNLSGRIPSGSQLQTFNPSAYSGNPNLCGPPLPNNCTNSPGHQVEGNEEQSEILWIYLGLAPGLVIGFWGFIGVVMIKRTIRIAYFRLIDQMYDWLYVKVAINFARMKSTIVKNKERQG